MILILCVTFGFEHMLFSFYTYNFFTTHTQSSVYYVRLFVGDDDDDGVHTTQTDDISHGYL